MKGWMWKMEIKHIITPDYENAGNLYTLEVTTDSHEEFIEAWELLLKLHDEQSERRRRRIYGD